MRFTKDTRRILNRILPFTLSLIIHTAILTWFAYTTWEVSIKRRIEENPFATLLFSKKQDNKSMSPGDEKLKNLLDQIKLNDRISYPLPEVEYRASLPEIKFTPVPLPKDDLNLIGVEVMDRRWLNPADSHQFSYVGGEKLAGSFSRHIQEMRETGLDIVFVFDATSSMAQFLKQVKEKIANLTATFKKLVPTARIGLVAYRDVGDDFVAKSHQLTHGTQSLQNFLRDIDPVGGGDWQESIGEALRVAIRDINWGKRTKKIILIIGDAPPHSKDMSAITSLINDFRNSMGGMVAALDTSAQTFKAISGKDSHQGETTKVLEDFKVIATLGGGESARLQDEEKVIRQMAIMVFGSKWEVCLDEFLKNL